MNSILGYEDTMRFQEYKADLWGKKEMQMAAVSRQMNEAQGHIAQIPVGVVELEVNFSVPMILFLSHEFSDLLFGVKCGLKSWK